MKCDVAWYINRCEVCLYTQSEQKAAGGLLGKHPVVRQPWQIISLVYYLAGKGPEKFRLIWTPTQIDRNYEYIYSSLLTILVIFLCFLRLAKLLTML